MTFVEKKEKLDYLLKLIGIECTGTAEQLAQRICVSKPTLERYLAMLREEGYSIGFCTQRKTYFLIKKED